MPVEPSPGDWVRLAGAALLTLAPGFLVALLVWSCLRRAFLRAGAGGALLALRARPPAAGVLALMTHVLL
jgi:hypothetical protein